MRFLTESNMGFRAEEDEIMAENQFSGKFIWDWEASVLNEDTGEFVVVPQELFSGSDLDMINNACLQEIELWEPHGFTQIDVETALGYTQIDITWELDYDSLRLDAEEDEIMAQMYEIEDKSNPTEEDLKNYANLETRMYELTRMSSEEGFTPTHPPMEFGEMVDWRPLDGTPSLKRQRAEDDEDGIQMENCESCEELTDVDELHTSADDMIICDECYSVDMSERDHLRHVAVEYDAEDSGFPAEAIQELKRNIVVFTGGAMMLSVFTAIGGFLLGRKTKEC